MLAKRLGGYLCGPALVLFSCAATTAATPCQGRPTSAGPTQAAPYAGPINHAHTAPAFQWGWFGAETYYPQVAWRRDYNGELMRWSVKRRY